MADAGHVTSEHAPLSFGQERLWLLQQLNPASSAYHVPVARTARATGLRNLLLHDTAQNQIWLEIVQIALDLLAWMPMLALTGAARLWEPRRLRLRLFSAAAQPVTTGRRRILRLAKHWPWAHVIGSALARLDALPNPG
jgi:hypothetical protein